MKQYIQSADRTQGTLFPEHLENYVAEDNPVRDMKRLWEASHNRSTAPQTPATRD